MATWDTRSACCMGLRVAGAEARGTRYSSGTDLAEDREALRMSEFSSERGSTANGLAREQASARDSGYSSGTDLAEDREALRMSEFSRSAGALLTAWRHWRG